MNTGRYALAGAGIQTAALAFGGHDGTGVTAITEQYDGVNWTEVADLNTGRESHASSGIYTSALAFGGSPPTLTVTE